MGNLPPVSGIKSVAQNASITKDVLILGVAQSKVTNRSRLDAESRLDSGCDRRRQLCVQHDYHETRTGWPSRRLAKRKQA